MGFTGHMNDADTELVYMQQRYYDPVAERFLSVDPVTTDVTTGSSFNRYVYAIKNPFKYIDPDGRQEHAAEAFGDQFRLDVADGNGDVYKPLQKPAMITTGAMLVVPVAIVAVEAAAVAIAGKLAQKHWKAVSLEQKSEIRDFLTRSEKAADKVAADTLKNMKR